MKCPRCNGKRSIFCTRCGGTKEDKLGEVCPQCMGIGIVCCSTCYGSGKVNGVALKNERSK